MFPSRKIIAAFGGVFLIGGLVGGLLVLNFYGTPSFPRFLTSTGDPASMAARINQKYDHEYNLNTDEQARIAPLTEAMAQNLYVLRRRFGVDIMATMSEYHEKIGAQMSPEHRAAFEQANVERTKHLSALLLVDPPTASAGPK